MNDLCRGSLLRASRMCSENRCLLSCIKHAGMLLELQNEDAWKSSNDGSSLCEPGLHLHIVLAYE